MTLEIGRNCHALCRRMPVFRLLFLQSMSIWVILGLNSSGWGRALGPSSVNFWTFLGDHRVLVSEDVIFGKTGQIQARTHRQEAECSLGKLAPPVSVKHGIKLGFNCMEVKDV